MNHEEFKAYLEQTAKLTRSQLEALKTMCERELDFQHPIDTVALTQEITHYPHNVSRGAW